MSVKYEATTVVRDVNRQLILTSTGCHFLSLGCGCLQHGFLGCHGDAGAYFLYKQMTHIHYSIATGQVT